MLLTSKVEEQLTQSIMSQKERSVAPEKIKVPVSWDVKVGDDGNEIKVPIEEWVLNETLDNPRYLFKRLAAYVNYFNSLGEFDYRALDVDLDQIPIPAEIADFIEDKTYRIDPSNHNSKDQKNNSQYSGVTDKGLSIAEWHRICYTLRSYKKVTTLKNMVMLDTLKKNTAYADIQSKCTLGGKVHFEGQLFIPIDCKSDILKSSYENVYFTHKKDDIVERYISEIQWTSNR